MMISSSHVWHWPSAKKNWSKSSVAHLRSVFSFLSPSRVWSIHMSNSKLFDEILFLALENNFYVRTNIFLKVDCEQFWTFMVSFWLFFKVNSSSDSLGSMSYFLLRLREKLLAMNMILVQWRVKIIVGVAKNCCMIHDQAFQINLCNLHNALQGWANLCLNLNLVGKTWFREWSTKSRENLFQFVWVFPEFKLSKKEIAKWSKSRRKLVKQ